MAATDLLEALPDLIVLLHRDGTVVRSTADAGSRR